MSGGFRYSGDPARMTLDQFRDWLSNMPEARESFVRLWGKPKIRIPVKSQIPNEADLCE